MRIEYEVEPVPQGNKTVRYRAAIQPPQQISKQPIPFVYVTKDWWQAQGAHYIAYLEITAAREHVGEYVTILGKNNHKLVHMDAMGVSPREANTFHHLPFVYMSDACHQLMGAPGSYELELKFE